MRFVIPAIAALFICPSAHADASEEEQDRAYLQCMIKRKVDPKNISEGDNAACLTEAGVEDLGDVRRKETGEAWRGCIIRKAAELDDGISQVTDIAKAIVVLCPREWREYVGTFAMYPGAKREMASDVSKYAINEGVQAVLLTRRVKRENLTPATNR
jgi:hypothetical protein